MICKRPSPVIVLAAVGSLVACSSQAASQDPNRLSQHEADQGWELLFDGESLEQWRGFSREALPDAWRATDGVLHFDPQSTDGGDIVTRQQFENFELVLEWRILAGGNSGIFFGVTEDARQTYHTGPEMQILDNAGHVDGRNPLTSAGSNYALHAPSSDVTRPVGEWNHAQIVVDGTHVEHWLNGVKVVEYERWTDEWRQLVAGSKFVEWPRYGLNARGHIALQDHGDPVWFRSVKIRRLPQSP